MAVSRASSDWLLHPSLVFKTFEESLIKSPFSYGNSPHIVPEKILESFVDQNGIRCYRVKWLDSWLTEQHVTAAFPHLITEYWINKPINDNVDYQNYIVQGRNLPNLLPVTTSNVSSVPKTVTRTTKAQPINDNDISHQPSTSITISQLFNKVEIPCPANVENSDNTSSGEADFNVANDSLQLPKKVAGKQDEEVVKEDKKFTAEQSNTLSGVPKISENSMVFLFDKNSNYTENNSTEREKSPIVKVQPMDPFNPSFKNQISSFAAQPAMRLPSMEQINQHTQHISSNLVQSETTNSEKKIIKRSPSKQAKPVVTKEKQPVVCDICGKTISSRKNLRVHKTVKHFKNGSFGCLVCGRKFALNRDLKRHMPLHTNERKYECPHCGLQCKQPGHLTKHIRTHTEVMNWRCDCCFKNFKVQAELKSHCFTEHADINKENLTCSVCKEKLKLPNSVYLHSLRHSGVREFQCHICKASFKLKQHMQVHMKTHEKPKDIVKIACPICQREFRFKHTFEKHFSKHVEKTKEEYDENARLKQEEKKRKQQEKRFPDVKVKRKCVNHDESLHSASDGEEAKILQKRKQRRPEKVLYDKEFKTKLLVREKMKQKLTCTDCELTFNTQALFKSHIKLHKLNQLDNKVLKIFSKPVSIEGGQIDSTNFPPIADESQMVMLKLPDPIIEQTESDKSAGAEVSAEQTEINNAISQNMTRTIVGGGLSQLENKEDPEVNCGDLSIDIGADDTVNKELLNTNN